MSKGDMDQHVYVKKLWGRKRGNIRFSVETINKMEPRKEKKAALNNSRTRSTKGQAKNSRPTQYQTEM